MSLSDLLVPNDYKLYIGSVTQSTITTTNTVNIATSGGEILLGNPSTSVIDIAQVQTNGQYFTNTTAGDVAIRDSLGSIQIGQGNGTDTSSITIGSTASPVAFHTGITLPTSGGTPQVLNYYEEYVDLSNTYGGIWGASQAVTLTFTRLGNVVTLVQNSNVLVNATTSGIITWSGTIPTRLRPNIPPGSNIVLPVKIANNLTNIYPTTYMSQPGSIQITDAGKIYITVDYPQGGGTGGNFSGTATNGPSGVYAFAVSYTVS